MNGLFSNLGAGAREWWANPYSPSMSVPMWFLFGGALVIMLAIWKIIFMHLEELA